MKELQVFKNTEFGSVRVVEKDGIPYLVDVLADMRGYNVEIFKQLESEANYALLNCSNNLVYQTYGKTLMARELGAIRREQFNQLNNLLVVNGINNPKAKLE